MKTIQRLTLRQILVGFAFFFTSMVGLASASATRLSDLPSHNLSHQALWLRDPSGQLTVEDVSSLPNSRLSTLDSDLSLGFTSDVVWFKVTTSRVNAADPEDWYLVLGQPLLKDVRLYKPLGNGGFSEQYGTQANPFVNRDVQHRRPVFSIHHHELDERTYWIRIETPTAMNTSLKAVQKEVFVGETTQESFFWGIILGCYIITIIFYISFWIWTREPIHKSYINYITINFIAAFLTGGWLYQFKTGLSTGTIITLLGISISLSITTGTKFSLEFIELRNKNPKTSRNLIILAYMVSLTGILLIIGGKYNWVAPLLQAYSMILISIFIGISTYYSIKGDSKSKFFLFAFSLFYFGVFWRYLKNISVVEPNFWNENIYQIAAFVHMLVMSIGIFASYNKLRKEKQMAESRADAEYKLREEQGEFLSLVSHEFRNPLTISSASVDNLLQQPDLSEEALKRVNKILKSNERMQSLINTYLSKERLLMDVLNLNIQKTNLNYLCHLAVSDMYNADISDIKINIPESINLKCDAEMLRIALNNLLQNSMRFSKCNGSIKISAFTDKKTTNITISDQGPGIPAEELDLIFTRYFRGKNSMNQPGAGLGLYLVNKIILMHGGHVSVRNLQDGGCEFTLTFPH
jgi:signal transduction histidine kinase